MSNKKIYLGLLEICLIFTGVLQGDVFMLPQTPDSILKIEYINQRQKFVTQLEFTSYLELNTRIISFYANTYIIEVMYMSEENKQKKQKQIEEELYKIFIKYIKKKSM